MYDGRKIQPVNNPNFLSFPFLEFYLGDYYQLGFVCQELRTRKGDEIHGYSLQSSDGSNIIMMNFYFINPRRFEMFVEWFLYVWWHEYLHLIGLYDDEWLANLAKGGKFVIEFDGDD